MPTTGQTRQVNGRTEWWWGTTWHTVPPPTSPTGGRAPAPTAPSGGGKVAPTATGGGGGGAPADATAGGGATTDASPFDANYQNRLDLIRRNLADLLAGLDVQQSQTIRNFGLDDPTDPYSRAALLKKAFGERVQGSTNSYAARGQLYAGSLQNAQNANLSSYNQGYDALRKQQADILAGIAAKRAQAQRDAQMGILDSTDTYTQNALSNLPTGSDVPLAQNTLSPLRAAAARVPTTRRRRTTATGGRLYSGTLATGGRI